jgi:O-antigen/teichoic acid export membrane protein
MVSKGNSRNPKASARPSFTSAAVQTYGSNLAFAFLSFLNALIVSRALGPVGRGDVVFLTAIAWLTSHLATMGIQEANANLAGSEPRLRRALASNSVLFAAIFGTLIIVVLAVLIAVFPAIAGGSDPGLRWMTLSALPVFILSVYLRFLVQADYGFAVTNVAWLLGPLVNVAANGLLAALGLLTVGTALGTWIVGQLLGALMLVWYVARRLAGFGLPDLALARRTLSFGLKSHAGRIMLLGNYRLDQWLLGAISGSRELGLYSVAVAWAEGLWYLPTALAAVQRPHVVRADRRSARMQAAVVFRVSAAVTAIFAVVMILIAPLLCVVAFGEDFRGATDDLRVLALGAIGVVALKQLGSALTGQGKPTLASAAIAVAFVATLALDVLLIPHHGGLGAAIASSVSYLLGGVAVVWIFSRSLGGRLAELVPRPRELVSLWRQGVRRFRGSERISRDEALAHSADESAP